ncbi:hypothetical protein DLW12_25150 [Escherichia coli]|nr:hypothetical protein [Escherichia coli]EFD0842776.1 hypothetical protein [Escherichia coli]EFJ0001735.1 hypothetical protein [Escherichia coli]EGE3936537.1 hypothetical protein [Escherichia coli]
MCIRDDRITLQVPRVHASYSPDSRKGVFQIRKIAVRACWQGRLNYWDYDVWYNAPLQPS